MAEIVLFLTGVVIGLLVAAPIGPVNLICIRRTLAYGPLNGFFSGLGGAAGDGIFAIVAAFGLTAVAHLIEGFATPIKLIGGVMLIGFGVHNFRAEVTDPRYGCPVNLREKGESTLAGAIASTFVLTITNPATLLGFVALFTGINTVAGTNASFIDASVTVAGVIAGSAGWWFSVTAITGTFHRSIDAKVMRWINHISGVLVTTFGLAVLGDVFFDLF
jgi:threonine/homoserine/homoserine lactone efflux protein